MVSGFEKRMLSGMFGLLSVDSAKAGEVEEPKPKPAKIRAASYEAAIDQLFKRMRSSSSAPTQQAQGARSGPIHEQRSPVVDPALSLVSVGPQCHDDHSPGRRLCAGIAPAFACCRI